MTILDFIIEVILVSALGVLSPGPLFLANLIYGSKSGFHAGIKIAVGHTLTEFPLVVLIGYSLSEFSAPILTSEGLRIIGVVGGTAILFFSISQIIDIVKRRRHSNRIRNSYFDDNHNKNYFLFGSSTQRLLFGGPFVVGIIFSALNPFFLAWWLTVGLKLISDSVSMFGLTLGVIFLFSFHIWMDYTWLGITSHLAFKGKSILSDKFFQIFLISICIMLASLGLYVVVTNLFQESILLF